MKRRVVTLQEIIDAFSDGVVLPEEEGCGVMYWAEVENMGFCKDGVTRFYMLDMPDGEPVIYFKH